MKIQKKMKEFIFLLILFISSSVYTQWTVLNTGTSQNLNTVHFINQQTGFAAGANGTVIKTTNEGVNWIILNSGSSVELRGAYFFNATTGMVCGYNGTILRTSNGGTNWSVITSGTTNHLLGISFFNESNGICVGNSGTTLYTTNGGLNWLEGQPSGFLVTFYTAFMLNASTGYCAGVNTIFSPLWAKTTNAGANWTYGTFMLNNNEGTLRDLHFFDATTGVAVSNLWNNQGAFSITTNGGVNWTTQIYPYGIFGLDFPAVTIGYAAGFNGNVYKSIDAGITWNLQTSNTSAFLKSVDFVDSVNGFIAGDGGVILKTTNGGITAVTKNENQIPSEFRLYQNYPNPFNPATKIKFNTPPQPSPKGREQWVRLLIYDILGREAAVLVSEHLAPGTYEASWDASDFSSGVYFYKLTIYDISVPSRVMFSETRKMVLIR
jgi:photosystem II stability/assembly factor-like uncharacterized protein